jgi:hypothetical protein
MLYRYVYRLDVILRIYYIRNIMHYILYYVDAGCMVFMYVLVCTRGVHHIYIVQ